MFKKKIVIDELEKVIHSDDAFAPVGYLNLKKMHLEEKENTTQTMKSIMDLLPMMTSNSVKASLQESESLLPIYNNHPGSEVCGQCVQNRLSEIKVKKLKTVSNYQIVTGIAAIVTAHVSMEESVRLALQTLIDKLLEENYEVSEIICINLFVADLKQYAQINAYYNKFFSLNPPVRVCVQTCLPENVVALFDCIACKSHNRTTMHVQGLSHWAPANIGPYSQAVKIDDHIFVAGMVGLIPATLEVVKGGCAVECRLSLQHVCRVLQAMHDACELKDLVLVVCYVTENEYLTVAAREWKQAINLHKERDLDFSLDCSTGADPIVQYQVVEALPKAASVEWQVVAAINCRQRISGGLQKRYQGYMTETTYISHLDSQLLLSLRILLELECIKPVTVTQVIAEYLKAILEAATECCSRFRCPKTPFLQIFFRQDVFQLQSLLHVFEEIRPENELSCLSFVPVKMFESSNCVLAATSVIL